MFDHLSPLSFAAAAMGKATADSTGNHEYHVLARFGCLALSEGMPLTDGNLLETGRERMRGLTNAEVMTLLSGKARQAGIDFDAKAWPKADAPAGELSPSSPAAVG